MPSLLDACNEVLLMVGERRVSNFASTVGQKVRLSVRRAQHFVGMLDAWKHLRSTVPLETTMFLGSVATTLPFTKVYSAYFRDRVLMRINSEQMRYKEETSPLVGEPQYFAVVGENRIEFYPTPTAAQQPLILVSYLRKPTISNIEADVMEGPDSYNDLVTLYAQVVMHRSHTTDLNAAEATVREFETSLHMYRTQNTQRQITYM